MRKMRWLLVAAGTLVAAVAFASAIALESYMKWRREAPLRLPSIEIQKVVYPAGIRAIEYRVQYRDGTKDHDAFVDTEPFGTLNELIQTRRGMQERYYYNDPEAKITIVSYRNEITPRMNERFEEIRRLVAKQVNVDDLPWVEIGEGGPVRPTVRFESIPKD